MAGSLYPSAWYPFARAAGLERGVVRRVTAFGTGWAVFRTGSGQPAILHATCAHLGADLTRGCVTGERLQCGLHAWEYGADGRCAHVPGSAEPPTRARQAALPAIDHLGLVWGYLGEGPPPERPTPQGFDDPLLSYVHEAELPFSYPMIGTNAFDTHHLLFLHHRRLVATPEITVVSDRRIRLRWTAAVVGDSIYDRLTRALGVREVEVDVECWGGTQLLFHHRKGAAFTVLAARALDDARTHVYLRTGRLPRWSSPLLRPLDRLLLHLQHRLILTFVFQDLGALQGMTFRPGALLPDKDREFIAWHRHFLAVPRVAVPE